MPEQFAVEHEGAWSNVWLSYIGISGAHRLVNERFTGIGGQWVRYWRRLIGSAAPAAANAGPDQTSTNSVTVTPLGGTGPYTYSWARNSSTTNTETVSNATAQTVNFNIPGIAFVSATWTCTITDVFGASVGVAVPVNFAGSSS